MLVVFLGQWALAAEGRRTPASDSTPATSSSTANTASATTSVSPNALVASLPDAHLISAEVKTAEPSPAGNPAIAPAATTPSFGSDFLANNSLAPIHALMAPPTAVIKLKTSPRTHSFFDSRNRLGFATLGASLTADALSTQKGLAYPGFVEMNPIARPFVQSRMGAAVYNAGSFGLVAGLMYWAHRTEHHKLERYLPLAVGSWEGLLSARNYHVIANRAR